MTPFVVENWRITRKCELRQDSLLRLAELASSVNCAKTIVTRDKLNTSEGLSTRPQKEFETRLLHIV